MKKELEAQLAAAKSESKATVEALKRELYAVTEERDKLKARCQQVSMLRIHQHTSAYVCAYVSIRQHTYNNADKARCQQLSMLYVCYMCVSMHVLLYIRLDTNVCALRWRGTCGTQQRTRMLTYADVCADGEGHGGLYDERVC